MMNKQEAKKLIDSYLDGTCTTEERIIVEQWYNQQVDEARVVSKEIAGEEVGNNIFNKISLNKSKNSNNLHKIAIAALVLLVSGLTLYLYRINNTLDGNKKQPLTEIIKPGGNKAYLTLENGKQIELSESKEGIISAVNGVTITKTGEGQIVYVEANISNNKSGISYNSISTPKGGQFQIRLPDGSNVWLNAESSLKYPASFTKENERKVELKGEAYFEVAHNKEKPFIVKTSTSNNTLSQEIHVLGTHFNINSYDNEAIARTTLLEGSILIKTPSHQFLLKPNQQASLKKEGLTVSDVDPNEATAWKDGRFMFNNEGIESIMRKISRWYNVDVEFESENKDQVFSGTVSKYETVEKVLSKLELTGAVTFKIEERRIIVK